MASGGAALMADRLERVPLKVAPDGYTLAGVHVNHRCWMSDNCLVSAVRTAVKENLFSTVSLSYWVGWMCFMVRHSNLI